MEKQMTTIPQAVEIGRVFEAARLSHGYTSRASLVETKKLRSKITQEGLRKIERGERVPRLENIRLLSEVLGLSERRTKALEKLALEANIQRVTRRAGNATVDFKIEGKPVKLFALPPKRKVEHVVREIVEELSQIVYKYGVMDEDVEHFRRHARHSLLKRMA